jgi:hypothetical protein
MKKLRDQEDPRPIPGKNGEPYLKNDKSNKGLEMWLKNTCPASIGP